MSTSFDDRERAFEMKYKHDEETAFKIAVRRAKLLGLWAAEEMGLSGVEADTYAKTVVSADLAEPGHEDLFRKVFGDLKKAGAALSEHRVREKMSELLDIAADQVRAG
jgi:hypothetical protein